MDPITRMSGFDAGFLYLETPSVHMHTLKIAVLTPSPDNTFENLIERMTERLPLMPPLRRRIVPVPFGLYHPLMVLAPTIDPARHFFLHDIGGEGSMEDLHRAIGEVCSTPLERDVPLWELHLCHGMADGRVAVVGKVHHAVADGLTASRMIATIMDVSSADHRPPAPVEPDDTLPDPSPPRQVGSALRDAVRHLAGIPRLLITTLRQLFALLRYRRRTGAQVPKLVLDAPRTSFNGPLTPRRTFASVTLSLADLKRARTLHADIEKLTLNDIVLAVVSGALRTYLAAHDEVPHRSLLAGIPVSLEGHLPRDTGNNLTNLCTTLATDVDDPAERLRTISSTTHHAKAMSQLLGSSLMDWSQLTPPAPFAAAVRAYSHTQAARFFPPPFNVIVSNVPGPREPVKIGGAQLSEILSVGPLTEGIGLNVTAWSYLDRMHFSLLACPDLLDDVEALAAHFPDALAELLGEPMPGATATPFSHDEPTERSRGAKETA